MNMTIRKSCDSASDSQLFVFDELFNNVSFAKKQ